MNSLVLAGLALLALASCGRQTFAHSWYPYDCCSDRDCWPMGLDADAREPDPAIVPGGYRTHDGTFVAEALTRISKDGRFHICRSGGSLAGKLIAPSQRPFCLFVPPRSF